MATTDVYQPAQQKNGPNLALPWRSAKIAWHEAFMSLRARSMIKSSGKSPFNNMTQIGRHLEKGVVQDAIAKLPKSVVHWGMYCYAPEHDKTDTYKSRVADRLYAMMVDHLGDKYVRSRIRCIRLVTLCNIALEDRKHQQWKGEFYGDAQKAQLLGVPRQNFNRDYGEVYGAMQEILSGYCSKALGVVAELLETSVH
ncbi:hypothetical protein [Zooshikella harenae]|uniref:Uncharacterized protein n=1 Tax=Zooshikella harenae TaxID=2827238 RepID=A0ABS5ZGH4_9GAMM|nr:hypothetical protein [Zooshikella harenae]MBU2713164.1 hypothetical protein [Zooshikella harenae]